LLPIKKASAVRSVGCCWNASGGRESSAGRRFRRASFAPRCTPRWFGNLENRNEEIEMSQVRDENFRARRLSEHGGSRFNFLLVVVVIAIAAYTGYQYVPVAYQASQFKVSMQDAVDKAVVTDKNAAWAEEQIRRSLPIYGVPPDAQVTVANREARIEAHVEYSIPVPLLITTYEYKFNHTARSANLLTGGG
jgi:hypothetical protein